MSVDSDLKARLVADGTINGLISGRVYPDILPQGPTYPALTYFRVSGPRLYHLRGASGRSTPRYQIDCWAETRLGARVLAEAVRASLSGFHGFMGTTKVGYLRLDNETDFYEETVKVYRTSLDFIIDHNEA
jgi:hypothetical protein